MHKTHKVKGNDLRGALPSVASIHLTEPAREKNGLDPLTPLATGSARSIRTSETADERLAVFVTCKSSVSDTRAGVTCCLVVK